MVDEPINPPEPAPEEQPATDNQSAMSSVLQQILDAVSDIGDRVDELDERLGNIESAQTPPAPAPEQPAGEPEPQEEEPGPDEVVPEDDEVEKAGNDAGYDMGDILQTIGGALQAILQKQSAIEETLQNMAGNPVQKANLEEGEEYPDDGYEDEEYSEDPKKDGEPEEEIEKCSGNIRKAQDSAEQIPELMARIADLEDTLKKARDRPAPVIVPDLMVKGKKEEKKSKNKGDSEPNLVDIVISSYGGV